MNANQLRSIQGYAGYVIGPVPDGVLDAQDWMHLVGLYPLYLTVEGGLKSTVNVLRTVRPEFSSLRTVRIVPD